jgi:hypothetical protein
MLKIVISRKRLGRRQRNTSNLSDMDAKRKVKAVSPSPFYDGKYHPPKMSSRAAVFITSKL